MVNGLVDQPLVFSYADLERLPRENHVYFCECAANTGMEWAGAQLNGVQFTHGMIHNMEYTGVSLRSVLQEGGLAAAGDLQDKWVYVEGADASSNGRSIPMEKALDDVLVAFKANASLVFVRVSVKVVLGLITVWLLLVLIQKMSMYNQ